MCECSICKKTFPEYQLTWEVLPDTYYLQQRKSMRVICDKCKKKDKEKSDV